MKDAGETRKTSSGSDGARSFTLIELLVVVAVVVILVGLIMPALSRAREKSRCAKCSANLKQLHEAVLSYAADTTRLPYAYSS